MGIRKYKIIDGVKLERGGSLILFKIFEKIWRGAFGDPLHPISYVCKALQQNNCSVVTCTASKEEQRKHCNIPAFNSLQVHS
jgi:hypothetical protein